MKSPTRENIEIAKQIRHKFPAWEHKDELLYREFRRLNKNVDFHEVAYKIALLDGLYGCNLRFAMDEWGAAEFIINTKIDDKLRNEDPVELVNKIAAFSIEKKRKRTNMGDVFASKYCHFHKPSRFAICDTFVKLALGDLTGEEITEYRQTKENVDKIIENTSEVASKFTYKDVDEYLWSYGHWLKHQKEKPVSSEFKKMISKYPELFSKLIPVSP